MESIGPVAQEKASSARLRARPVSTPARGREALEMATFHSAGHWFAVPAAAVVEAVDDVSVTRMPGSSSGCSGVIRFRDQIVPLLNLETLGCGTPGKTATVIVVTVPGHSMIGLQVEALGDVVEAPVDSIVPLPETLGVGGMGLAARLVKPEAANGTLFLLLEPESLAHMIRAPQADRLSA